MKPTLLATITADTLNTSSIQQIAGFLRTSVKLDDGRENLRFSEVLIMLRCAEDLETILSRQTPKPGSDAAIAAHDRAEYEKDKQK